MCIFHIKNIDFEVIFDMCGCKFGINICSHNLVNHICSLHDIVNHISKFNAFICFYVRIIMMSHKYLNITVTHLVFMNELCIIIMPFSFTCTNNL